MTHVKVLHAPHAEDLDLLGSQKKAVPLLKRRPAPGVVVLPEERKLGEIHQILSGLGWWPMITTRDAGLPPHSVVVDERRDAWPLCSANRACTCAPIWRALPSRRAKVSA